MKRKLTIAIIIPVYNEAEKLKDCLDSVASQTRPPDEVIVVDNNSTDKTAEIARKYSFVTLLNEPEQGLVFARGTGFDAAKSEILCRIDADSRLPERWLESVEAYFRAGGEAVTGPAYFYDIPFRRFIRWFHTLLYFRYNRLISGSYIFWGSNMALTKTLWNATRSQVSLDNNKAEDMDLCLLVRKQASIGFEPAIYQYASMQSGKKGLRYAWNYALRWPRAFRREGFRAYAGAWFITIAGFILLSPFLLLAGISEGVSRYTKK